VASASGAAQWNSKGPLPVRAAEHVPSIVIRNSVTGESVIVPFSTKRGKPTSKATLGVNRHHVGPVRPTSKTGFSASHVF